MVNLSDKLSPKDLEFIKSKNISTESINEQYKNFINGFSNLNIFASANEANGGIKILSEKTLIYYSNLYAKEQKRKDILKFVPASGAATRMFKDLFEYINSKEETNTEIENFISNIKNFAFYDELVDVLSKQKISLNEAIKNKNYKTIISNIIFEEGLNYGFLPKGLLKFHKYEKETRTAFEEHISESILYANSKSKNNIHFTVSPEHLPYFKNLLDKMKKKYEKNNILLNITFSTQDFSTNTIAVDANNEPFRLKDGTIFFRPGGHGALIKNLNNLENDIIFIKNIDNIVPDNLKKKNCIYKKALAGILIEIQNQIFEHINLLQHNPSVETIEHALNFLHNTLSIKTFFNFSNLTKTEKLEFLISKLDRPFRVCGMVKNIGEPGGGPFFVRHNDDTASLQIVEKSQLDLSNKKTKKIFEESTHFNPVDIVFSPTRYNKKKFDLTKYIDKNTGLISEKNKEGKVLKAQELPGLWNGAMSDWNTIFIEVPIETFNPVKTIFDLLRKNHL